MSILTSVSPGGRTDGGASLRRYEAGYREYQKDDGQQPSPRLGICLGSARESHYGTPPHDARSTPRGRFAERNSVVSSTALFISRFRAIRRRVIVFVACPSRPVTEHEVVLCPYRVQQIAVGSITKTLAHRRRRRRRECVLEHATAPWTMAVAGVGASLQRRRSSSSSRRRSTRLVLVDHRCAAKCARVVRDQLHLARSFQSRTEPLFPRFSLSLSEARNM